MDAEELERIEFEIGLVAKNGIMTEAKVADVVVGIFEIGR